MRRAFLPLKPGEFMLYYAAGLLVAIAIFMRRRPRKGMRLRLRGSSRADHVAEGNTHGEGPDALHGRQGPENFSRIRPQGERPLNVMFNYNGHSWDAYEVLGLPAGSSPENVDTAYKEGMEKVDAASRPFLEAAYQAIKTQWDTYQKAGGA